MQIMPPGVSLKAKQGKSPEVLKSSLSHILGYTGTDMEQVGPPSPVGSEKETAAAGTSGLVPLYLPVFVTRFSWRPLFLAHICTLQTIVAYAQPALV